MKFFILNLLLLFIIPNSIGQEINKVSLEYKHPYSTEYALLRIEITKESNTCFLSTIKVEKKDIIDFAKSFKKMPTKTVSDCNEYDSIIALINDFKSSSPNELLGFSDIQHPRLFTLEFVSDNGIEKYESITGQSFKTNDYDLEKFNTIVKEILTLADYKWRKIL